jgi:hypothetical protein
MNEQPLKNLLFTRVPYDSLTHDSLTHDSLTHDSLTYDSLTHDSLTYDSLTHDSLTPRFTDNKKSVYFINQDENIFAKN